MQNIPYQNGWTRIDTGLDMEVLHGVPVRLARTRYVNDTKFPNYQCNYQGLLDKIFELTGFSVSIKNWIDVDNNEKESVICINRDEFEEVLRQLALSSAAMFVDRFHKSIDKNAVDWDNSEFNYDFNHAAEHCCIPYNYLDKKDYIDDYIKSMHDESIRIIDEGISPIVEAE